MNLTIYYTEICKEPMLSKEEELKLFQTYRAEGTSDKEKEKIRDTIIRSNLRFVFKTAKDYSRSDPSMIEDLISAGNEGLLVGFEKYNPSPQVRFLSYAGWWVVQRILKEMSHMRIVSLPIWKQQLSSRIERARANNENITIEELHKEFPDIKLKDLKELFYTRYLTYYIDDCNESEFEIDPIGTEVQTKIDNTKIWKAVSSLPSPHREIVAQVYGLLDGEESSVANLCRQMKIPKSMISKIRDEGLQMLKDLLIEP